MTSAAQDQPTMPLRLARHAVGMMILAAANPLIYYSDGKLLTWAATWSVPLVFAAVVFALYALFLTKRAKAAWPKSFFMLAWVLLALSVAGPYIEKFNQKTATTPEPQATPAIQPAKPRSEIDEFLKDAPPHRRPQSNSSKDEEDGPWMQHENLRPFHGTLDGEPDWEKGVMTSPVDPSQHDGFQFDPSTARKVEDPK